MIFVLMSTYLTTTRSYHPQYKKRTREVPSAVFPALSRGRKGRNARKLLQLQNYFSLIAYCRVWPASDNS